jgi:hypothetical protein
VLDRNPAHLYTAALPRLRYSRVYETVLVPQRRIEQIAVAMKLRLVVLTCGFGFAMLILSATAQTEWTSCATEGGFCTFSGTQQVRYGANGSYFYKTLSEGTPCTNSVFW